MKKFGIATRPLACLVLMIVAAGAIAADSDAEATISIPGREPTARATIGIPRRPPVQWCQVDGPLVFWGGANWSCVGTPQHGVCSDDQGNEWSEAPPSPCK